MTLEEFIRDLQKDMKKNGWQKRRIVFSAFEASGLEYLSIYPSNKTENSVTIEIGSGEE